MRGRRARRRKRPPADRLTPANAGTTPKKARRKASLKAHPRECGDDRVSHPFFYPHTGSPPRMRGRLRGAASTLVTPLAHPRECGDDAAVDWAADLCTGSPPRMRGRRSDCLRFRPADGLTPANAGTTYFTQTSWSGAKAHPRECGDDRLCGFLKPYRNGSPPRMRGRPGDLFS